MKVVVEVVRVVMKMEMLSIVATQVWVVVRVFSLVWHVVLHRQEFMVPTFEVQLILSRSSHFRSHSFLVLQGGGSTTW